MSNTKILETFRFDFTYRERDMMMLNVLFTKYGYPNLTVDLSNDYDGYWSVRNSRNRENIWTDYHTGFVTFFVEDGITKIAFDHKVIADISKCDYDLKKGTYVYFESVRSITSSVDKDAEISRLTEEINVLKKELEFYQKRDKIAE